MSEMTVHGEDLVRDALERLEAALSITEHVPEGGVERLKPIIEAADRLRLTPTEMARLTSTAALAVCIDPKARAANDARRYMAKMIGMDAYESEEEIGWKAANIRKAEAMRKSARQTVRQVLDPDERSRLARLIAAAKEIEGEGCLPLDIVWLFETAFGHCSRGFAWVCEAGLDLPSELLDEIRGLEKAAA